MLIISILYTFDLPQRLQFDNLPQFGNNDGHVTLLCFRLKHMGRVEQRFVREVERTVMHGDSHTGVHIRTLYTLLTQQIYAGLCFADTVCTAGSEEQILEKAQCLAESFIRELPEMRTLLATDAAATFNGDPAAQNINEVIFCYPGFRAICNYRIAHQLYLLKVPFIPRIITEMAHSETGIDIHPGAQIGHHFSIDHGTGTVIGETSVIGNYVRIFQGVSLAGEKLPPDENGNTIRGVARHPILGDHVTVYSNATLLGHIHIGDGATICGNVWVTEDVPAGKTISQLATRNN